MKLHPERRDFKKCNVQSPTRLVDPKTEYGKQPLNAKIRSNASELTDHMHTWKLPRPPATQKLGFPSYGVSHLPPWSRDVARAKDDSKIVQVKTAND